MSYLLLSSILLVAQWTQPNLGMYAPPMQSFTQSEPLPVLDPIDITLSNWDQRIDRQLSNEEDGVISSDFWDQLDREDFVEETEVPEMRIEKTLLPDPDLASETRTSGDRIAQLIGMLSERTSPPDVNLLGELRERVKDSLGYSKYLNTAIEAGNPYTITAFQSKEYLHVMYLNDALLWAIKSRRYVMMPALIAAGAQASFSVLGSRLNNVMGYPVVPDMATIQNAPYELAKLTSSITAVLFLTRLQTQA